MCSLESWTHLCLFCGLCLPSDTIHNNGLCHGDASLVIEDDTVSPGTHSTVDTQSGTYTPGQFPVVSIEGRGCLPACRSNASLSNSGSSLPRAEALRRIP